MNINEIKSGYFWEIPTSNPLVDRGILTKPEPELDSITTQLREQQKEKADPSIFERFWETLKKRGEAGKWIIERGVAWETTRLEAGLLQWANVLWWIADLTGDALVEAFTEIAPESIQAGLKEGVENLIDTDGGGAVLGTLQKASKNLEDLKELDPVVWARFQWGLDFINWALTVLWGKAGTEGIKRSGELGSQAIRKSIEEVWPAVSKIKDVVWKVEWSTLKDKVFWGKDLDELVLEATQGKAKDVPAFKKAISQVDIENINTYKDLDDSFGSKIKEIARKQDEILPTEEIHKLEDLVKTSKWGTVSVNYTERALDDMIKLAEKTDNIDDLERLTALKEKGIYSVKDINNIAREYNTSFGKKAFTVTWEPKFTNIGQSYENIRKWVKETSRDLLPDDTMKALDTELSNLYSAKSLSEKMVTKVDDLVKRLEKRGLLWDIANKVGHALDYITLWVPKEIITAAFLKSWVGKSMLDSLTLQEKLGDNLKKITQLIEKADTASSSAFADDIIKMATDVKTKVMTQLDELKAIKVNTAKWIDEATNKIVKSLDNTKWQSVAISQTIKDFIKKYWEEFKNKLWELFDELADKFWVRSKFMDDTGKSLDDFSKAGTTKSAELIEEAKKFDNVDDFISSKITQDYHWYHQILWDDASQITTLKSKIDEFADIAKQRWEMNKVQSDNFNKLKKIAKMNPDDKIKIYRGTIWDDINNGDWVTFDKDYAQTIVKQNWWKLLSKDVRVWDLLYPNNKSGFNDLPSLWKFSSFRFIELDKFKKAFNQAR